MFYLQQSRAWLERRTDLTVVAPLPIEPGADENIHGLPLAAGSADGSLRERIAVTGRLENLIRRVDPVVPPSRHIAAIRRSPEVRSAIVRAELADLQWTEYIGLAPRIRAINPRIRVVATFHDVMSQLMERQRDVTEGRVRTALADVRLGTTRSRERRLLAQVDTVACLTEKDADLLRSLGAREVHVVDPPVAPRETLRRSPAELPTVGIVAAFGRPVNVEGARWFVERVWPDIRAMHPTARLRLIGNDPTGAAAAIADSADATRATGFVEDLEQEYARLWVNAVPLLMGSGVKFKTLEAMSRGVPTVATPVGAEGVPEPETLEAVTSSAAGFANAVGAALTDPASADRRAAAVRDRVRSRYGQHRFSVAMERVYLGLR